MTAKLKVFFAGLLAAALMLGAAAPAFAAAAPQPATAPQARTRWDGGQVTAVGADSFTVLGPRGVERTVLVTATTQFFDKDAQPSTLADLHVGDRVRGAVAVADDHTLTALIVFNLGPQTNYRGGGVIASVDAAEQSFIFTARPGRVWEFYVDDATTLTNRAGDDLTFADLDQGDKLFVHAELRADGQWWAVRLTLGPRP